MNNLQEKVIRAMVEMYGFYSIEELAEMTDVSVSSIKHSLGDIADFIEGYEAKLLRVPRKGICMVVTDQQREKILEALDAYANSDPESFYYRKNYILDILFHFPANYTIQLFSEELCVSRKIIQKDLNKIEEYLEGFHLELSKVKNQGIRILGREFDVRQAIVDTQNKKYWKHTYIEELPKDLDYRISKRAFTFFSDYYSVNDIMLAQEYLAESEKELGVVFVDISFCRITEYLLLTQKRIKEDKKIRDRADRKMTVLDDVYINAAKMILDRMFPGDSDMELEYQFLAAKLAVAKTCEVQAKLQDDDLMDLAKDYIDIVFRAMEKENTFYYKEMEKQIATFLKTLSIKHDYMLVEWDDLHKDIQQQLPSLYAVCLTYAFRLEENLGFVLTQDDIAWIALLIHQASVESGSEKQGILVTATDPYTAKYEAMKIENEIGNLEIVKNVHINDYKPEKTEGKIVISTVPLKEKQENVIEITKHVTQMDLNKIVTKIDEYNKTEQNQQVIETVRQTFQRELIVTDAVAVTKKEAIAQASELLIKEGYLNDDVTERVFELEERRPTTIGNQIAMAHVYKDNVEKSGIAVMRMKYPVQWSRTSKIRLVFFLAINMEGSNEILMLFKFLYALIDNKKAIEKILNAKDSEQIYQILMDELH